MFRKIARRMACLVITYIMAMMVCNAVYAAALLPPLQSDEADARFNALSPANYGVSIHDTKVDYAKFPKLLQFEKDFYLEIYGSMDGFDEWFAKEDAKIGLYITISYISDDGKPIENEEWEFDINDPFQRRIIEHELNPDNYSSAEDKALYQKFWDKYVTWEIAPLKKLATTADGLLEPIQSDEADLRSVQTPGVRTMSGDVIMDVYTLVGFEESAFYPFDITDPYHRRIVEFWVGSNPERSHLITWEVASRTLYPGMETESLTKQYTVVRENFPNDGNVEEFLLAGGIPHLEWLGALSDLDVNLFGMTEEYMDGSVENTKVGGFAVVVKEDGPHLYLEETHGLDMASSFFSPDGNIGTNYVKADWDVHDPAHRSYLKDYIENDGWLIFDRDKNVVSLDDIPVIGNVDYDDTGNASEYNFASNIDGNYDFVDYLNEFTAQLTANAKTPEEKLKTVYDFIVKSYQYKNARDGKALDTSMRPTKEELEAKFPNGVSFLESYAYADLRAFYLMRDGEGVCDNYAALFMLMAEDLGFEAKTVSGRYINTNGTGTGHTWTQITVDGVPYYFDAQIESSQFHRSADTNISYQWWKQPIDDAKTQSRYEVAEN